MEWKEMPGEGAISPPSDPIMQILITFVSSSFVRKSSLQYLLLLLLLNKEKKG